MVPVDLDGVLALQSACDGGIVDTAGMEGCPFSKRMVLAPDSAADRAAVRPAIPEPTTTTSAVTLSSIYFAGIRGGVSNGSDCCARSIQ